MHKGTYVALTASVLVAGIAAAVAIAGSTAPEQIGDSGRNDLGVPTVTAVAAPAVAVATQDASPPASASKVDLSRNLGILRGA